MELRGVQQEVSQSENGPAGLLLAPVLMVELFFLEQVALFEWVATQVFSRKRKCCNVE